MKTYAQILILAVLCLALPASCCLVDKTSTAVGQTTGSEETPTARWQVEVRCDEPRMDSETSVRKSQTVHLSRSGPTITLTTYVKRPQLDGKWGTSMEQIRLDVSGWQDLLPELQKAMQDNGGTQ